jgi:hypothetical protein
MLSGALPWDPPAAGDYDALLGESEYAAWWGGRKGGGPSPQRATAPAPFALLVQPAGLGLEGGAPSAGAGPC